MNAWTPNVTHVYVRKRIRFAMQIAGKFSKTLAVTFALKRHTSPPSNHILARRFVSISLPHILWRLLSFCLNSYVMQQLHFPLQFDLRLHHANIALNSNFVNCARAHFYKCNYLCIPLLVMELMVSLPLPELEFNFNAEKNVSTDCVVGMVISIRSLSSWMQKLFIRSINTLCQF